MSLNHYCQTHQHAPAAQPPNQLLFKAQFGDDLRRVSSSMAPSGQFADIVRAVQTMFQLPAPPKLSYTDEDGDEIVVGSLVELRGAQAAQTPLRLKVTPSGGQPQKKAAAAAAAERDEKPAAANNNNNNKTKTTCAKGHALVRTDHALGGYQNGWVCNCCSTRGRGERMMCLECHFDACAACVAVDRPQLPRFAARGVFGSFRRFKSQRQQAVAKTCAAGHALQRTNHALGNYKHGFVCDECHTTSAAGSARLACLTCEHDVCDACVEKTHVHHGVTCDGCNTAPIVGARHKCRLCADFDFCDACFNGPAGAAHKQAHADDIFHKVAPGARHRFRFGKPRFAPAHNAPARPPAAGNHKFAFGSRPLHRQQQRKSVFLAPPPPAPAVSKPLVVAPRVKPTLPAFSMAALPAEVATQLLAHAETGTFIISRSLARPNKLRLSYKCDGTNSVVHRQFNSVDEIAAQCGFALKVSLF